MSKKEPVRTIEDFFTAMWQYFRLEEGEVRSALKAAGFTSFKTEKWHEYFMAMRDYNKDKHFKQHFHPSCPICQGKIRYFKERDGKFGEVYGWDCIADPKHYFMHLTVKLQKSAEIGRHRSSERRLVVADDTWYYEMSEQEQLRYEDEVASDRKRNLRRIKPFIQ